jgi:hypothetical protein
MTNGMTWNDQTQETRGSAVENSFQQGQLLLLSTMSAVMTVVVTTTSDMNGKLIVVLSYPGQRCG